MVGAAKELGHKRVDVPGMVSSVEHVLEGKGCSGMVKSALGVVGKGLAAFGQVKWIRNEQQQHRHGTKGANGEDS